MPSTKTMLPLLALLGASTVLAVPSVKARGINDPNVSSVLHA